MSCFELKRGCCGCPIRNTVCSGLLYSFLHGVFIVCFVFSNTCYPPFYYVDYMVGGCGAGLVVLSVLTMCVVDLKRLQFIRGFMGLTMIIAIFGMAVTNYYYAIVRWNDFIVTAFEKRRPDYLQRLPDELWMSCAILTCIAATFLIMYTPFICSFMCTPWKSHLFESGYRNNQETIVYRSGTIFSALSPNPRPIPRQN